MYRTTEENPHRATRTLEVHQGKKGWYFTVHQEEELLLQSDELPDRAEATSQGIFFLDRLNQQDYDLAMQKKGKPNGQ
jgi:hypothetical protein